MFVTLLSALTCYGAGVDQPLSHAQRGRRGGNTRAVALTPAERADIAREGAAAVNRPAGLARRIVKRWPTLPPAERDEVRRILRDGGVIK